MYLFKKPLLAVAMLALAGCATNPYPEWSKRQEVGTASDKLDMALAVLQKDREAVSAKLKEYSTAQTSAGNFILGSGIVSLVAAASGGSRDAILVPSLLAGSAYSFNRYNDRTAPSTIYKQALEAYDCIEIAVTPYCLGAQHRQIIESAVGDNGKLAALTTALANAEGARNAFMQANQDYKTKLGKAKIELKQLKVSPETDISKSVEKDLAAVGETDPLLAEANKSIQRGQELVIKVTADGYQDVNDFYAKWNRLPETIMGRLSRIRTATESALSDAQPSLDSTKTLLGDLPRVATGFGAPAGWATSPKPVTAEEMAIPAEAVEATAMDILSASGGSQSAGLRPLNATNRGNVAHAATMISAESAVNAVNAARAVKTNHASKANSLIRTLVKLSAAASAVDLDTHRVAAVLQSIAKREDYDQLAKCGIDKKALQAEMALTVDPASIAYTEGGGGTTHVAIKGGTPSYVVSVDQPATGKVTVTPPVNNGWFTVIVDKDVTGTFDILVGDAAGHIKRLPVQISKK